MKGNQGVIIRVVPHASITFELILLYGMKPQSSTTVTTNNFPVHFDKYIIAYHIEPVGTQLCYSLPMFY